MAAQQVPACHEQIGERTGDEQAVGVLFEPAIAHLEEAEDPLDDPGRVLDFGSSFDLVRFFARSLSLTMPWWR